MDLTLWGVIGLWLLVGMIIGLGEISTTLDIDQSESWNRGREIMRYRGESRWHEWGKEYEK